MGVKLCICIPTCNRSECMTRVLNTELEMLKKLDIHIWIYDSSTDNDTKSLVLRYQKKGYANLFISMWIIPYIRTKRRIRFFSRQKELKL